MAWKFVTAGPDGLCRLFGVNIFDYAWQTTGKRIKVKDPVYHQDHTFEVRQVEIGGQIHRFAAGEFSNCVWGLTRMQQRLISSTVVWASSISSKNWQKLTVIQ